MKKIANESTTVSNNRIKGLIFTIFIVSIVMKKLFEEINIFKENENYKHIFKGGK